MWMLTLQLYVSIVHTGWFVNKCKLPILFLTKIKLSMLWFTKTCVGLSWHPTSWECISNPIRLIQIWLALSLIFTEFYNFSIVLIMNKCRVHHIKIAHITYKCLMCSLQQLLLCHSLFQYVDIFVTGSCAVINVCSIRKNCLINIYTYRC